MTRGDFRVLADGKPLPAQVSRDSRGVQVVVVVEIEANGELDVEIVPRAGSTSERAIGTEPGYYENPFIRLEWSAARGIFRFFDKSSATNILLDENAQSTFGSPVYQLFREGNRSDAGFRDRGKPIPSATVSHGKCRSCRVTSSGPVFTEVRAEFDVAGATGYDVGLTLFDALPQVYVSVILRKLDVIDPEGMYTAFPFALDAAEGRSGARWRLDKPGGAIRPGIDQIPGTCCDYYLVQDGAVCIGRSMGVSFTTLDAPLVHLGA